jgi:hypothetical protein
MDAGETGRAAELLETAAKSGDEELAADAILLLAAGAEDSSRARHWARRLRQRLPGHANLIALRDFLKQ